jgi:hydrogenase maturation factor HypF (carbamoyltransferase family)
MAESNFDLMSHPFKCPLPECGQTFEETYRRLIYADVVTCPKCGMKIDIREAKRTGDLGKWFDTCAELDKKRKEKP